MLEARSLPKICMICLCRKNIVSPNSTTIASLERSAMRMLNIAEYLAFHFYDVNLNVMKML